MKLQDDLTLELRTYVDGLFTLGTDRINLAVIASDEQLMDDNVYEWSDIMDGVISIDIKRGVDTYTGAYALPLPSVGVMHIVTRNKTLDPNVNIYMVPKTKVRLRRGNEVIFQGRMNNQFVDYRSDKSNPVVSFDVMDPVADLQQTMTRLSSISAHGEQSWNQRLTTLFTNAGYGALPKTITGGGKIKHGYWADDRTLWEALVLASNTEGGFIFHDKEGTLQCYASETIPTGTTLMEFNNEDPTKYGYKNIALDYNVQSTINEVVGRNSYGSISREFQENGETFYGEFVTVEKIVNEVQEPVRRQALINRYGTHALNVETNFNLASDPDNYTLWANAILNKWQKPTPLVKEIEWDGKKNPSLAASSEILDRIKIHHKTDSFTYEETLTTIGVQHSFNADQDTWRVKFILFPRSRFI
jgi:hypothetical protein